jgi:hypothetical protein
MRWMANRAFEDDQVEELLDRIASGKESLMEICRDPRMPGLSTVYDWIECDPEFAGRFRARKAIGVRAMVDQCREIADEPVRDAVAVADKRVRIDTRLRLAGKWLRDEFGDQINVHTKSEVTHRHDLSGYSADELDALEKLVAKSSDASRDTSGEGAEKPGSVH